MTVPPEALGCDPIEAMARLVVDENEPIALRFAAMKELAQYVAPKRKAVEVSSTENQIVLLFNREDAML
jgi:hypothetical protein